MEKYIKRLNTIFTDDSNIQFSYKRKPMQSLYSNAIGMYNAVLKKINVTAEDITSFVDSADLDPYFQSLNQGSNLKNVRLISDSLYTANPIYSMLMNYLSTLYYYRYKTLLRPIKNGEFDNGYEEQYRTALEVVDGISFETVVPLILSNLFIKGAVYIYTIKNKSSNTVSSLLLPPDFCRPATMTQFGTNQVQFNFEYFDKLRLDAEQLTLFFTSLPDEFLVHYNEYLKDKTQKWFLLDSKYSSGILMNTSGFPTFLSVFYDLIDYKSYKSNELLKNSSQLTKLVVQEFQVDGDNSPSSGKLTLPEIEALHNSMAPEVAKNVGAQLVTTAGKIHVENLQENDKTTNNIIENAYKEIFNGMGLNSNVFNGDNAESLTFSVKKDLAFVWSYIDKIMIYYNVTVNNLYKFKNYQLSINMLPISIFNEKEQLEIYHQSATLGIGVLDYIIASGTKQVDLEASLQLESKLNLVSRLTPLQSSHTQSSGVQEVTKDSKSEADDVNQIDNKE